MFLMVVNIKILLGIMKISVARNHPRMMISGARILQSHNGSMSTFRANIRGWHDIGFLGHNEVFWAQKSSFLDDFWTISGAINHLKLKMSAES